MDYYGSQLSRLIEELSALPGVGAKTAQRLAFHIINMPEERADGLAKAIVDAKHNIRYCRLLRTGMSAIYAEIPNATTRLLW